MPTKAPRPPTRLWHFRARGALSACCMWLAGASFVTADTITSARFIEPTTRYAHGVLGDNIEYGALELSVKGEDGAKVTTITLPEDRVFEDLAPRLWDVDSDGDVEAVVVESQDQRGAQLAIYDATGTKIATTPHIGTRFRWLAPIGAADLDGDDHVEIAYVDRPHLAKTLRIWRFKDDQLAEIAAIPGLTNHKIGEDFISGGLRLCNGQPELIVVNADWSRIISVSYLSDWTKTDLGRFDGPDSLSRVLGC